MRLFNNMQEISYGESLFRNQIKPAFFERLEIKYDASNEQQQHQQIPEDKKNYY